MNFKTPRCARLFLAPVLTLALAGSAVPAQADPQGAVTKEHFLLVWAGDRAGKGNDFLVVIDADPGSSGYGHMVTTLATDQQTVRVHHTEYTMPASGMLFANDHDVGRSFIFDVRDPRYPKIAASFSDLAGYMHPHSYVRLPNGHVLATFQHAHHDAASADFGKTGGLVEINDAGEPVRAASNADAAFPAALLMPYGLVVLPAIDRIVSTNSSMHDPDIFSGVTYQVWRMSDLKLLHTAKFDVGDNLYAHIGPEEPRLGPDGSVFVQTLGCGLERITGIETPKPHSKLVYTFPGNWCGVPTIVGHYFVQSVPAVHGFIVLDIGDPGNPVEVSRLRINDNYFPHWTGWDPVTHRLVVTSSKTPEERTYLLRLDEQTGALSVDQAFRDADGQPGFSFNERDWPHGWHGAGIAHGAVFTQ